MNGRSRLPFIILGDHMAVRQCLDIVNIHILFFH